MSDHLYTDLFDHLQQGWRAVLTTRYAGNKGAVSSLIKTLTQDAASGSIEEKALAAGLPAVIAADNETIVAEPFFPEERLIVLGGGHIALPLTEFAARIHFSVTVADDRLEYANKPRFPQASEVLCKDFESAIMQLKITPSDYVVIVTRGHRYDEACLLALGRGAEPFYTGMIGSRRRVAALKAGLIEKGYDSARLSRVHTPIGLAIGAVTPEEIAVSIAAELIACKRISANQTTGGNFTNRSDVDISVLRALANETDEPKAIVTVISAKGSVPRGPGAKMLVYPNGKIAGSIGGGCSEAAVVNEARGIIGTGAYALQTVDMTGDIAEEEGMVCGGVMQVLIEDYMIK
jgi:xanthine dehydrogenase accessory factor